MPAVNILIKPASSSCNLQCKYCFYNDVAENRDIKNYGVMSVEVLEKVVKEAFEYGEHFIGFAFQGGEPTLAGLDFYKKLVEYEKIYNNNNIQVTNAIQTNGTIIDEEWAEFLAENDFLVGLSLDGPKEIHDINRVDKRGTGSYIKIQKTIELFEKYKVQYNILCVVTKLVARHAEKIYNYYTKNKFQYLQFIPCLDELGVDPGKNPYSLTPEIYGDFLKKIFELWYRDFMRGNGISIRMFDNILQMLLGYGSESCDMNGSCSANIVMEADGSVYPCDFYVINKWELGNIKSNSFDDMLKSENAEAFIKEPRGSMENCENCEFLFICKGGCKRHYETADGNKSEKNYFCKSFKEFYKYSLPGFYEIAKRIGQRR